MTNTVNVVLIDPPSEGSSIYAVVKDSNNLEVFSGEALVGAGGLIEIGIGESSQAGEAVFVYIDNGNFSANTFKSTVGRSNVISPEQWVAQLDGATQYWQLSDPILIFAGYKIEFTFANYEDQSNSYLLCSNDSVDTGVFTSSTTGYLLDAPDTEISIDVDGMGEDVVTFSGGTHMVTCDVLESGSFQKLCSRFNETRMLSGWIKNLTVKNEIDEVILSIPLTNKAQGATQLATVGNVNATMINYTGDEWEQLP